MTDPILYDVGYQRLNHKGQVVAAVTFPVGRPMAFAGEIADGIGMALRLKQGSDPHSWLTIMPTDSDEYVYLIELESEL